MNPSAPRYNSTNARGRHAEDGRNLFIELAASYHLANLTNLSHGQLCRMVTFALFQCTMSFLVCRIFKSCSPAEIIQVAIASIAIQVSAFLPRRAGAYKFFQHQSMNTCPTSYTPVFHAYRRIAARVFAKGQFSYLTIGQPISLSGSVSQYLGLAATKMGKYSSINGYPVARKPFDWTTFGQVATFNNSHDVTPLQYVVVREPVESLFRLGSCYFRAFLNQVQ